MEGLNLHPAFSGIQIQYMNLKFPLALALITSMLLFSRCARKTDDPAAEIKTYEAVAAAFGSKINLNSLANYGNQALPAYLRKDNAGPNAINNGKATLGRILFYDKQLSLDNSISCASCHRQSFAFGDTAIASRGVSGGLTGRHSMRLVNARFAAEGKFFWDERAATLQMQTTMPIKDHAEMGYSGVNGRPGLDALLSKLGALPYYRELFQFVYGNTDVTEFRLQECLSQFILSIQSFDARYDAGRAQVANDNAAFPNFTAQENMGKNLFLTAPVFDGTGSRTGGGLGCNGCHNAPEFDIDPNSGNNGIIGVLNGSGIDVNNTRAPSLRDLTNADGNPNTPMMHTGNITTLQTLIGHYGAINIAPGNNRLDPRLRPAGNGQRLNLNAAEVNAVIAFLKTLTGSNLYTDSKWSDPFL